MKGLRRPSSGAGGTRRPTEGRGVASAVTTSTTTQRPAPLIELDRISRWYGSHRALHEISLTLRPGRIGLLGPNGAGKSTLLKILLGLLPPSSGRGRVFGHEIGREGQLLRRAIGYMPEADALVPGLCGAEFVALAGELYGMPRRQAQRRA